MLLDVLLYCSYPLCGILKLENKSKQKGATMDQEKKAVHKVYSVFANRVQARQNCRITGNSEWFEKHTIALEEMCKRIMPSGGGFDCGTTIDLDKSTGERLIFSTSFHHMDINGGYDGWTEHTITVKPSLIHGILITISGRNKNDIKEYIHDSFHLALTSVTAY